MGISIEQKPEMNVVNVGDELTTDQLAALQNAQGASATNPVLTRTNTFNTADAAVRITQEGAGAALVVEDSTNPDSTPFKIENDGRVGILGNTISGYGLTVNGSISVSQIAATGIFGHSIACTTTASSQIAGTFTNISGSTVDCVRITNLGTGNSFVVEDSTNPDTTPFVVTADGNVGISVAAPTNKLQVAGNVQFSSGNFQISNAGTASSLTVSNTNTGMTNVGSSFSYAGTGDAVRITNTGTGNSFVVEDESNPDATPFVINSEGRVGIGTTTLSSNSLTVGGQSQFNGTTSFFGITTINLTSGTTNLFNVNNNGTGSAVIISQNNTGSTADAVRITNLGSGNSFVVEDSTNPDSSQFVIGPDGDVGIGSNPVIGSKLNVQGNLRVIGTVTSSGAVTVSTSGTGNAFRILNNTTETFNIAGSGAVTLTNYLTLHTGAYSANTAQASVTSDYPHELEFKVGSTTYRVPARAI